MTDRSLSIDVETRSTIDLTKAGLYVYAEHPTTDVLCAAYRFSDEEGPCRKLWTRDDPCPQEIVDHVAAGGEIRGWNVAFERMLWWMVLCERYGWPKPALEQFWCTAAEAATMGLPRALGNAAPAVGLEIEKDQAGHRLMLRMCKPKKIEDDGTIIWVEDENSLERLYAYCLKDVDVEMGVAKKVRRMTKAERQVYIVSERVNDRGIYIDMDLVERLADVVDAEKTRINADLKRITNGRVSSASNHGALLDWLRENDIDADSVSKAAVRSLLEDLPEDNRIYAALSLRQEAAKSSTAKLTAMKRATCIDGRARGTTMYHGATTGRYSGKLIQVHNFPRAHVDGDPEYAAHLAKTLEAEDLLMLYGSGMDFAPQMLRPCMRAAPGKELVVNDYSNVEGRMLAFLSGEDWKTTAFRDFDTILPGRFDKKGKPLRAGPDLYKLAYAKSFKVDVDAVDDDGRQVGKVLELSMGFAGGKGAFQSMARNYGVKVTDAKADEFKVAWRQAHPETKSFWYELDDAAVAAVMEPGTVHEVRGGIEYFMGGGHLWCRLPSKRLLCYPYARIQTVETPWGTEKEAVSAMTIDSRTRKYVRRTYYHGLWCENVVQAACRDLLVIGMLRCEEAGYPVVLHVHDELVAEVPKGFGSVEEMGELMTILPAWAEGLPLAAAGWRGVHYRKD